MSNSNSAKVLQFPSIEEMRKGVDQLTKGLEEGVQDLGKRAADAIPEKRRKQVDEVIERLGSVREDLEERIGEVRGGVEESISSIRERGGKQTGKFVADLEKEVRAYVEASFKRLKLPVRSDLVSLKRRLSAIERRLDSLEKAGNAA